MNFLPIVERELRVRATQAGFRWMRVALAGFAVLACLQWFNFNLVSFSAADVGQQVFASLTRLAFVLALGAGLLTADCVSRERREGTLGLLFLTTLKSRDVTLGKFASAGVTAVYALLGFLPLLWLPVLAGGVTGGEVFRFMLALINLMLFSLAVGLFVSVFARQQITAIIQTAIALFLFVALPKFLELIASTTLGLPLFRLSPVATVFLAGDRVVAQGGDAGFWWSLLCSHILVWLLLGAANFALAANWHAVFEPKAVPTAGPEVRGLLGAPRMVLSNVAGRKRAFAPVARAMLRMPGQSGLAWLGALLSVAGGLSATVALRGLGSVWAAVSANAVFGFMSAALFAFVAGRFLFDAKRNGELELLLVTPAGAKGILREQRFALVRLIRWPFYFAILGGICVAVSAVGSQSMLGLAQGLSYLGGVASGILAACWMGAWVATWARNPFSLMGWTVGLVELLPVAIAYLLPLLLMGSQRMLFAGWIMFLPTLLVAKNLVLVAFAREKLRREFRMTDGISFRRLENWRAFGTPPGDHGASHSPA